MGTIEYFYMLTMRWLDPLSGEAVHVGCQRKIMLDPKAEEYEKYDACLQDLATRYADHLDVPGYANPIFFRLMRNEPEPPLMVAQPDIDAAEIRRRAGREISEMLHDYMDEHGEAWTPEVRSTARLFAQLAERYAW